MSEQFYSMNVGPDWRAFMDCVMRKGTPKRVHLVELFLDPETEDAVCERFGLLDAAERGRPFFEEKRNLACQRFLGYDYVRSAFRVELPRPILFTEDTAGRVGGRGYIDEHSGPITTWQDFEEYPWPSVDDIPSSSLEWYQENLPEDMCIVAGGGLSHFYEWLNYLMGYETLCYALVDDRELVRAICDKALEINIKVINRMLQYDRVKATWGSDDMGFRSGTLLSPADMREFILPGHKKMSEMSHAAGRPYFLHSCGKLSEIMEDLIEDVRIDAKHSFEDTIEDVADAKKRYGDRIAVLGGIDLDFLCRATEEQIRARVRKTLDQCLPGGGYCLGTGNSVANYVPLDNYLAMVHEGRKYAV